jgi:16S rRNA (guanine1207-N2)-methyltransferase
MTAAVKRGCERWRAAIPEGIYGNPSAELVEISRDAMQLSPLIPGSARIEDQKAGAFERITMLAPAGVLERRFALAQALRILRPGGRLVVLALKDRGGARLAKELTAFGCTVDEAARRHYRICTVTRPSEMPNLDAAIVDSGLRLSPELGLWTQPGIFSWDRPDPGTALLLDRLPALEGEGADLGCGLGVLGRAVLNSPAVTGISLIDIDRRAIEAARRNIAHPRAHFEWIDLRRGLPGLHDLDFVVMNPPFHDGGAEDRALGEAFIRAAASILKPKGVCWLVANRHLPYERPMMSLFPHARRVEERDGYKIYEARI